jgi:CHAD domain-containing protein
MKRATVAARIRALAAAVEERALGVTAAAPDAVHDLRVACRRLETALRLWGRGESAMSARREARSLRRTAAPAREAEVLRDLVRARWVARIGVSIRERRAWLAALAPATAPPAIAPAVRARLAVAAEDAASRLESCGIGGKRPRARLARWRATARRRLAAAIAQDGDENLHRARLALKRWRYAEEALTRAKTPRSLARRKALRHWQRELGVIHDLSGLARFVLSQGEPGLVAEIERRRHARLERLRRRADGVSRSRPRSAAAPP